MKHTIVIAEAGVNHNGSIEIAKQLIDKAKEAGADYVKFQTFVAEKLAARSTQLASYQRNNIRSDNNSQLDMLKTLELTVGNHIELIEYCKERGIKFLSSAFDLDSIELLASFHLGIWKVPSGEITNYPYLKKIAKYGEPVIISTGMCNLRDVEDAINVLLHWGLPESQITILHCNTEYPTPYSDVNLKAMLAMRNRFGTDVGYSDHTIGIEVPIAAVALGASVIEKHFTLDRTMEGPDHKASLEPEEFKKMVTSIRNIELALGDGVKRVSLSEKSNIAVARKSIVASCNIKRGEVFSEENLTIKRPGLGISPMRWDDVIGCVAKKDFQVDDLIAI